MLTPNVGGVDVGGADVGASVGGGVGGDVGASVGGDEQLHETVTGWAPPEKVKVPLEQDMLEIVTCTD